jgi:polyisoprenoid-binding protein YceI
MQFDGTLTIDDNRKESSLDGTLLATQGAADPFGDATSTIENHGFGNNQSVRVTGNKGQLGNVNVIFMTSIQKLVVTEAAAAAPTPPARK